MANVIRLKRASGSDPAASDLVSCEPAVRTDTGELFFKKDDGSIAKVAGAGGGPDFKYLALRNAANNGAASFPNADFTLVTSGTTTAITPTAANTLLVSVNGVIQKPNTGTSTPSQGFALSGSTIKFGANISAAPDFILYQESGGIGEPSDETVSEEKLKVSNSPVNGYFLSAQSGNTGGLTWAAPVATSCTGNSATATALATARTINGTSFDGTANITVTAAAGTLTGNTLNSSVTASSLTSLGDLSGLTVTGNLAVDTNTLFVNASTNRVGIGTTSPSGLLSLQTNNPNIRFDDSDTNNNAEITLDNTQLRIEVDEDNAVGSSAIKFRVDGSDKAVINSSGRVGIGTTSPAFELHVGGSGQQDLLIGSTDAGGARLILDGDSNGDGSGGDFAEIMNTTGGDLSINARNPSSDAVITFSNNGSERMTIDGSGNVGIGTTSPDQLLHLSSTGTCKLRLEDKRTSISNTSQYGVIQFEQRDSNTPGVSIEVAAVMEDTSNGASGLQIKTGTPSTIDERFRIDRSGNVGIGTASPDALLDVVNTGGAAEIIVSSSTQPRLMLKTSGTTAECRVDFGDSGDSSRGAIGYNHSDDALKFYTTGVANERMRINSSGHLLINTTSVGGGSYDQLSVAGGIKITDDSNSKLEIGRYSSGSPHSYIKIGSNSGSLRITNAADNSDLVTITDSGRVGIGLTNGAAELDVAASVEDGTGTLAEHGIRLSHVGATDEEVIPITGGFVTQTGRVRAGIGFISKQASSTDGYAGAIGFYTRSAADGTGLLRTDERMRINQSGKVGIGTTSPDAPLVVRDASAPHTVFRVNSQSESTKAFIQTVQDSDLRIGSDSNHPLNLYTNGNARLHISNDGKVGIGTSSPAQLLEIHGASNPAILLKDTTNNVLSYLYSQDLVGATGTASNHPFVLNVNNGEKMRIDTSGNIAIGNTNPQQLLHVWPDAANTSSAYVRVTAGDRSSGTGVQLGHNSSGNAELNMVSNGHLTLFTNNSERLTILNTGNVGIGTTSPQTPLHVYHATSNESIRCESGDEYVHIVFKDSNTTSEPYIGAQGNDLRFITGGTKRLNIANGGDIAFNGSTSTINSSNYGLYLLNDSNSSKSIYFRHSREANGTHSTAEFHGNQGRMEIMGDGDVRNTNNSYGSTSDATLKQDIVDASSQWDDIKAIRVRKFRFKDNPTGDLHIGVVAQELETVSPKLVTEVATSSVDRNSTETVKAVKYSILYMKAIKALQEAQTRIETLETKVTALEAK